MPPERFTVAQVTPYAWEQHHDVNRFVERLSDELCARGHRVVVLAPSDSRELIRESRAKIKRLADDPEAVFAEEGCASVIGVGQSIPFPPTRRGIPVDVSRRIEAILDRVPFDFVHVHEPFAPSASSAALRHSRALNVGTFHSAAERVLSTQVARRVVELFFGRLDGRTASYRTTAEAIGRYFAGDYRVIMPGTDLVELGDGASPARAQDEVVDIVYSADEERGALRLFLRALRRLPASLPWRATVWSRFPGEASASLSRRLRDRVHFAGPRDGSEAQHLARAHIAVAASSGVAPSPQLVLRGLGCGAVPVASRLPAYEEALREGELGLLFEPRDADTLAGQLTRLIEHPDLRAGFHTRAVELGGVLGWPHVADAFEDLYRDIAGRRHEPDPRPAVRRRLERRDLIDVDLHMHTDHSPDCATPVGMLLDTAEAVGLGAIAVTDHNEIAGAHAARELADREGRDIKVIVAEEVKTADQGEVIGLFVEDKIERGMTLEETIEEIRRQGGLVYVPHPFDRMHTVPGHEHLLRVVDRIDAIEVFNAKVAVSAFNEEAARFAAKYRVVAGAGSDSHVPQGLGSVRIRMRDFDGPEEFIESLRDADLVHKRQRLLYVQALKFLQTRGGRPARVPSAARRSNK